MYVFQLAPLTARFEREEVAQQPLMCKFALRLGRIFLVLSSLILKAHSIPATNKGHLAHVNKQFS